MTNTIYSNSAVREYYDSSSASSSSFSEQTPQPAEEVKVVEAASSLYTAIGNACLACARPLIQLQDDGDDELMITQQQLMERVNYFAHVEHPNLVRLLGYGFDGTHRVLVYEFTSRESLEDHLFESSSQNFTWSLRMKVALDAAKGLAFIHSFPKKVIHGYIKPSNILVDSNYNAKLSGFELTKDRPTTFPEEVMDNGDYSYSIDSATIHDAPEYRYTGQFSAKSDVFSFGVVFLEILCGRRAFEDSRPSEEQNLLEWTVNSRPSEMQNLLEWTDSYWSRNFKIIHVLDSRIAGQYSKDTVLKAVKIAVKCLSIQVKLRPTMDEVVQALEELQN